MKSVEIEGCVRTEVAVALQAARRRLAFIWDKEKGTFGQLLDLADGFFKSPSRDALPEIHRVAAEANVIWTRLLQEALVLDLEVERPSRKVPYGVYPQYDAWKGNCVERAARSVLLVVASLTVHKEKYVRDLAAAACEAAADSSGFRGANISFREAREKEVRYQRADRALLLAACRQEEDQAKEVERRSFFPNYWYRDDCFNPHDRWTLKTGCCVPLEWHLGEERRIRWKFNDAVEREDLRRAYQAAEEWRRQRAEYEQNARDFDERMHAIHLHRSTQAGGSLFGDERRIVDKWIYKNSV